jgi:predicted lipid-binding transport protein (Tim44 family)
MSEFFDVYTLIYLVIAVLVLLRLRRSLGQRTGHEKQRHQQGRFGGPEDANQVPTNTTPANDDTVVTLPGTNRRSTATRGATRTAARDWGDFAKPRSVRAKTFNSFAEIDPDFDPGEFVDGARAAYEMIVNAFAEGDRKTLQSLLSPEVYDEFLGAIAERTKRDERIESSFVSIDKAEIKDAKLNGSTAHLVVSFVSQMITATLDKDGEVIDGDPSKIIPVNDIWTFARDLNTSNPNWKLVATGS